MQHLILVYTVSRGLHVSVLIVRIILVKPVQICLKQQGKIASVEQENHRPPPLNETPVHQCTAKQLNVTSMKLFADVSAFTIFMAYNLDSFYKQDLLLE